MLTSDSSSPGNELLATEIRRSGGAFRIRRLYPSSLAVYDCDRAVVSFLSIQQQRSDLKAGRQTHIKAVLASTSLHTNAKIEPHVTSLVVVLFSIPIILKMPARQVKRPSEKTPIRQSLCGKLRCSLKKLRMGKSHIQRSVRISKAAHAQRKAVLLTQWPMISLFQDLETGVH